MNSTRLKTPVNPADHVKGSDNASSTLVEYGDFECPYCRAAEPVVRRLAEALGGDLRLVFRNFPLTQVHPNALNAAKAAESAGLQGRFWEMAERLFKRQRDLGEELFFSLAEELGLDMDRFEKDANGREVADKIAADFEDGVYSGVNGTPTFFINGERYNGEANYEDLFAALREARLARSKP